MNEIVNKFSLAGDKFMHEMHFSNHNVLTMLADNLLETKNKYKI